MDAFAKGWSVQEIVWAFEDGFWWIDALRHKDPSNFGIQIDPFGRLTGLLLQLPGESEQKLDSSKFVVYANRDSYGRPKGRSDLDAAWRHWVIKTQLVAAWKLHLERFAMPTILGRFRRGLPASEISGLLSNLENLHKTSAVVFPNEIEIETLGGLKEPSTGFMEAIEFHNREIARSILGQTLTTDEGRRVGSLALGKVHLQVLLLQLEAVREDIADRVMNEQVIRPLCEYNFGPGLLPRFEFEAPSVSAFVTGAV